MSMQKEIKNSLIVGNSSRAIFDVIKSDNIKNKGTKVILRKDSQGIKDYFLYHSISKM